MMQHVVFFISYTCYVYFYILNCKKIIYPLILFPIFVYLFLAIYVYFENVSGKGKFSDSFHRYSKLLYVFVLFLGTPFFSGLNLPDPHNFVQRKFEIMLGAGFVTFICLCGVKLAFTLYKNRDELIKCKNRFWIIVLFFFVFYSGVSLWFNYANQPTGDEPEYIMMAHSLLYDRDLNLKNNFENKDYKLFYKDRELYIQGVAVIKGDKIYSYHPFMISMIIAPFYLIGQRFGAALFINFVAALLIGVIFIISYKGFNDTETAVLSAFVAGFSMPVLNHINNIATDVASAFVLSAAFYFLLFERNKYLIFSFLLMLGLWLHLRNAPVLFLIFLFFVFFSRKNIKAILIPALLQAVNILLLLFVNKAIYGVAIPKQVSGGEGIFYGFGYSILNSFIGMFFDQEFGLFFYTPLFILLPAGYYFLYKIRKEIFYSLLFVFLPFLIFICSWDWRGGGGSSPRFLLPLICPLIIPVAAVYYACKDKALLKILSIVGFVMSYIILLIPWFRWNKGFGENWILRILSTCINFDLTKFFPSIPVSGKYPVFPLILWIIVVVVLNILVIIRGKNTLTNKE